MPEPKDPSKHHYIPQFYLKWWTGEDGRLERYTRPVPNKVAVRRVFPSETGFSKDLYLSPGEIMRESHWLETRIFQRIDDRAALVMRKLNATPPIDLNAEEQSSWSVFVRTLFYRTPAGLHAVKDTGAREWLSAMEAARERYHVLKGPNDPDNFDDYMAARSREEIERSVINVLPNIFVSEGVGQVLNDLHKRLIDLPRSVPTFLISDDLLSRTNGIMVEGGHFALPISPRRLMVMSWQRETLETIVRLTPTELVTSVNRWVVESARHFVGAVDKTQDRFVRNRFGSDLKIPISKSTKPSPFE